MAMKTFENKRLLTVIICLGINLVFYSALLWGLFGDKWWHNVTTVVCLMGLGLSFLAVSVVAAMVITKLNID